MDRLIVPVNNNNNTNLQISPRRRRVGGIEEQRGGAVMNQIQVANFTNFLPVTNKQPSPVRSPGNGRKIFNNNNNNNNGQMGGVIGRGIRKGKLVKLCNIMSNRELEGEPMKMIWLKQKREKIKEIRLDEFKKFKYLGDGDEGIVVRCKHRKLRKIGIHYVAIKFYYSQANTQTESDLADKIGGASHLVEYLGGNSFLVFHYNVESNLPVDIEKGENIKILKKILIDNKKKNFESENSINKKEVDYVIMEYYPKTVMKMIIKNGELFNIEQRLLLCYQVCLAISELKRFNVKYFDIKLENFLFSSNGYLIITDFSDRSRSKNILDQELNARLAFIFYQLIARRTEEKKKISELPSFTEPEVIPFNGDALMDMLRNLEASQIDYINAGKSILDLVKDYS